MMKLSLEKKIVILIILIGVILSGTCICVSAAVNRSTMKNEYMITADSMSATVAVTVDGDQMAEITQKVLEACQNDEPQQGSSLMQEEIYLNMQESLRKIQDVSEADRVYAVYLYPEEKRFTYIIDAGYIHPLPAGHSEELDENCYPYLDNLEEGIPAFIKNTRQEGWIATSGAPIYDSQGNLVCFAAVDLSMNDVFSQENKFLYILIFILTILTGIICIIAIVYVKRRIVKPINMLSDAARQYSLKQNKGIHGEFSALNIHTGDELEILLDSMVQMEKDIDRYIENLTLTQAQLYSARKQADNMHELAHMDSLTGIRNRLAYDKAVTKLDDEIQKGFSAFGIAMVDLNFLKSINDTYGHECGNSAIIALSQLICEVFAYSPVFRIGGDEFAVILKNLDYEKAEQRIQEFNERLEDFQADSALQPWEKISAALGYALFDGETDCCVEDVFKQADKNMYQRKKAMKAMRT